MTSWDGGPQGSSSFAVLDTKVPRAGIDYPQDEAQLATLLGSEAACWRYVEQLRFPDGFVCPSCEVRQRPWRSGTSLLACTSCRQPVVLTHGTLFQGSAVPISRWMRALWQVTDREVGVAGPTFQSVLGLPDATVADELLSRIRELMALPAGRPLSGDVGVAIARVEVAGERDPGAERPAVVLAYDRARPEPRIRLRHLPRVTANAIGQFVAAHVEPGSRVVTAPWRGFAAIESLGYEHVSDPGAGHGLPGAEAIWSLLKQWLHDTPGVDPQAIQAHLDEFTFRFNRRNYPRGLLFYRLVMIAVLFEHAKAGALLESA
jgi:hypothetical protein